MTTAGWLRDFWRKRLLNQWSARDTYPPRLRRKYGSDDERARDGARLLLHGYRVVDETDSGATIDLTPQPSVYSQALAPLGPVRMDLPLAIVFYERDASSAGR